MLKWYQLHPKVKAAFFGFLLAFATDGAAQLTNTEPKLVPYITLILPVLLGYLRRESQDAA